MTGLVDVDPAGLPCPCLCAARLDVSSKENHPLSNSLSIKPQSDSKFRPPVLFHGIQ